MPKKNRRVWHGRLYYPCHISAIAPPMQSQGAAAYDLLTGHEIARERGNNQ